MVVNLVALMASSMDSCWAESIVEKRVESISGWMTVMLAVKIPE